MYEIRAYARRVLCSGLSPRLDLMRSTARWTELILHRDGHWQTELAVIHPGVLVPRHRHRLVDSLDVAVGGEGVFDVEPLIHRMRWGGSLPGSLIGSAVGIPRLAWHGGSVGDQGGAFLSFQRWIGEAKHVTEDWEEWTGQR